MPARKRLDPSVPHVGFGNPTESEKIDRTAQAAAWRQSCADFARAGVHLFFPHVELTECWNDLGTYDFSPIDETVRRTLDADPEAKLILRLRLKVPSWWHGKRPGQRIRYEDGSERLDTHWERDVQPVSPASAAWQDDSERLMRAAVQHVESSEYAERIAGYNPALLHGGEWFEEGSMYHKLADYSPCMQSAFGEWLERRYPDQNFPEECVPSVEERQEGDIGNLRDPEKSRRVIDYLRFFHDLFASQAESLCAAIREASEGRALVGIYYGYTLVLSGVEGQPGWVQNSGHLALRRLLDSPHIDYLSSMLEYSHRKPGEFCWSFGPLADSCRVHGKFYIGEDEIKTWLDESDPDIFYYIERLERPEQVSDVMLRNTACMLSHHSWEELVDLGGGWYRHPDVLASIGRIAGLVNQPHLAASPARGERAVSQIALFVDEVSLMYQAVRDADHLNKPLLIDSLLEFFHIGAPVDVYLFSDLTDGRVPLDRYRFLVFLNAFHLDAGQRAYIRDEAARDGRCILSFYAPGFFGPGGASEEGIRELTGFQVRFDTQAARLRVRVGEKEFGSEKPVSPVFYVDDPEAEVIGELVQGGLWRGGVGTPGGGFDIGPGGRGGLCRKVFEDWTSVYSAAPCIPAGVLRDFAKDAGVHIYVESDDLVHATRDLLAIHAGVSSTKRAVLPLRSHVIDPWTGKREFEGVRELSLEMQKGETRLWLIEAAET